MSETTLHAEGGVSMKPWEKPVVGELDGVERVRLVTAQQLKQGYIERDDDGGIHYRQYRVLKNNHDGTFVVAEGQALGGKESE